MERISDPARLDKNIDCWLVNSPCVQNQCTLLVITYRHQKEGGTLDCYTGQTQIQIW